MTEPLNVYIGYDARDHQAYEVCAASLKKHSSIPVRVIPIKDWELRAKRIYWRGYVVTPHGQMFDDRDGKPFSTQFSFTRFAVPILENFDSEFALFCDADMMWRADIAELLEIARKDEGKALYCVQHKHTPPEGLKMDGVLQTLYRRKNWSSLMLYRPWMHQGKFTPYMLNNMAGAWLHSLCWVGDEDLGALPAPWNWLEGWSDGDIDPKVVHYTRGTPDMLGALPYDGEWWSYLSGRAAA